MTGVGSLGAGKRVRRAAAIVAAPGSTPAGFTLTPLAAAPIADWAGLSARNAGDNVFFDPAFLLPLVRHLGGATMLATVRIGSGLVAAAPVAPARLGRVAPAWRVFANPYTPVGAPLIAREEIEPGAARLVEGLVANGHALIVPDLPLDGPVAGVLHEAAQRSGRPVVVLNAHRRASLTRPASGPASPREALSTKRRHEYRRQMLRLADEGAVAVESFSDPADVRAVFEEFLTLEASGWKGRAGSALLSRPKTAAFARAAVAELAAEDRARIDAIRVSRQPVAMLVTFLAAHAAYTWKIAFDERFARFSPGAQIMLEAGRAIFAETGVEHIDSCAVADHPMADHVWKDRIAVGTMVVGPPGGGALFAAGCRAARAEIAARAMLRKLKSRKG